MYDPIFVESASPLISNWQNAPWTEVDLRPPVRRPLHGFHQHDGQHGGQPLCEKRWRFRAWGLEHGGLLQLHQRLLVARAPGETHERTAIQQMSKT